MKTYRQSLDELHFTREEKNAMVDRLTAGESRGSGKVRSIRRTVTVGVAAALLMTMGVGAAVTLTPAGEAELQQFIQNYNELSQAVGNLLSALKGDADHE